MVVCVTPNENKPVTAMSLKMIAEITLDDDGGIHGELDSIYFKELFTFTSIVRMIEMMETTFDFKGFPEKQMNPRSFSGAVKRFEKHEFDLHTHAEENAAFKDKPRPDGKTCTFEISVRYRHNAEWQGSIHWVEKDTTKDFASIVEMVKLINEALAS